MGDVHCDSDKVRQVLDIILKTVPQLTQQQAIILSLQCTCTAWRAVLRCAATHSAHISCSRSLRAAGLIESFTTWLVSHSELLQSLQLDQDLWSRTWPGTQAAAAAGGSSSSGGSSTRWSSGGGSSSSPGAPASCDARVAAALQEAFTAATAAGLRLTHFSTNYLYQPALLQSLPASLLSLELSKLLGDPSHPTDTPHFTAALSHFTALQTLSLGQTDKPLGALCGTHVTLPGMPFDDSNSNSNSNSNSSGSSSLTPGLLAAVRSLPRLSALLLQGAVVTPTDPQQLPAGLTRLVLQGCLLPREGLDLSGLSRLLELDCVGPAAPRHPSMQDLAGAAASSLLPPSLTALTLLTSKHRYGSTALFHLTALQQLSLLDAREGPLLLLRAAALPSLRSIHLRYLSWRALLAAAPCWSHLPQLQSLKLAHTSLHHPWQLDLITSSLAAATSLTSVSITNLLTHQSFKPCGALVALPHLQCLQLESVLLAKGDPLTLTRLTGLTSLAIVNCSTAVDDVAAVALCSHLHSLRTLKLHSPGLLSMGLLYPIATGLRDLQSLSICGRGSSCCADAVGVGMLSGLRQLTELRLPGCLQCPALHGALRGLRRAVPGLTDVDISHTGPGC